MNKKIILSIVVLMAGIILLPSMVSSEETFSNESITNIRAIQQGYLGAIYNQATDNDSKTPYTITAIYYINVTGNPTTTYTIYTFREDIPFDLNINSLNNVNASMKAQIIKRAKEKWNYTLSASKILINDLKKGNEI